MNNYIFSEQFVAASVCIITGIIFGGVYDFFRVIRVLLGISPSLAKHNFYGKKMPLSGFVYKERKCGKLSNFLVAIGDILFFTLWGVTFAVISCHTSFGHVRWYTLIPMILGFSAYYFTCGKLVMAASHYAAFGLWVVVGYIVYFLRLPFVFFFKLIKSILTLIYKKIIVPVILNLKYSKRVKRTKKLISNVRLLVVLPDETSTE